MLSRRWCAQATATLLLWTSLTGGAQTQGQTLSHALEAAWARSPEAAALSARQAEAQARLDQARGLLAGPARVSISHLNDRLTQNIGYRDWEVELAAPLWLPGQKQRRESLAEKVVAALEARTASQKLQLAAQLRDTWWRLAAARDSATLAQQQLDTAKALESEVLKRFQTGELARIDANLATTERLAAAGTLLDAEGNLQQAQLTYRALTGVDAPAELPDEPMLPQNVPPLHPQVREKQTFMQLAEARLALSDASRREAPELALRWTSQRNDAMAPNDQAVGIKLTIPLSSDGRVREDGATARAELAQAEAELDLAQLRTQQELVSAQRDLANAQRQLSLAQERRALTADNLELAQRAFTLGETGLPALLRARADAHAAKAWIQQQETARALAQSRWLQAQGVLP